MELFRIAWSPTLLTVLSQSPKKDLERVLLVVTDPKFKKKLKISGAASSN